MQLSLLLQFGVMWDYQLFDDSTIPYVCVKFKAGVEQLHGFIVIVAYVL